MRPIKFRAYDADDKVMRSWREIDFTKDIGDDYYLVGYKASAVSIKYDHEQIIMQYTGLKDTNGVEIYEGDIVERTYLFNGGYGETHTGEVVYDKEYARYVISRPQKHIEPKTEDLRNILSDKSTYEVIGNIYENLELLKEQNN